MSGNGKPSKGPILVKSKSDMTHSRSVKFDLPNNTTTNNNNNNSSSRMSAKTPSPSRRRGSSSASPPRQQKQQHASPQPQTAASRNASGSNSAAAAANKKSASPSSRGRQQEKGASSRAGSKDGVKTTSKSPTSKSRKGSSATKGSPSPTRTQSGKSRGGSSSKGRSSSKEGSAKDEKKKKNVSVKSTTPTLTPSGLKILDWSGQGMTSIPTNMLTPQTVKDVGYLILASNNLRTLPVEIRRMKSLERIDLSRNGIRCTNSNDYSGLPLEMEQLTNLTELSISECNLPFVPPAIFKITSLKILDLSRNKVNILLPEIGELVNLVKLNLQQTNITSLPPEIAYCQELEEIYLWGNSIETLPETLPEMPKLRVLALNYRSFCGVVDPYMENLLKKGQIKSEHIPMIVFELPALESLDLESTKLNNLPDIYNIQLREFYLCRNFLQTIPLGIYNLKYLLVLDMSYNLLINLPDDIGRLKGLRVLRLANNNFERVPSTIGHLTNLEELNMARNRIRRLPPEIKGLQALKIFILERNNIQSLPEEICELSQLHTLDLTDNEIRTLPLAMHRLTRLTTAHGYHKLEKYGLSLYKNPLEQPPPDVWRTEKPDNIFEFLKKLQIIKTENLQRQKIQIIGESQAGKTSLVRVLAYRKSMLTKGPADKTRLLQQTPWKTENNVDFVLNDFGGDSAYRILYKMFMDSKALVLLIYDASALCEESYYTALGQWVDMLCANVPGAVVKLVGTKVDLLKKNGQEQDEDDEEDDAKTIISVDNEIRILYPPSEDSRGDPAAMVEMDDGEEGDFLDNLSGAGELLPVMRNTSTPAMPEPSHTEIAHDLVAKHLNQREIKVKEELETVKKEIAKIDKGGKVTELRDIQEASLKLLKVRQEKLEYMIKNPLKVIPDVGSVSATDSLEGLAPLVDELEHLIIDQTLFPYAQRMIPGHWNRLRAMLKQRKGSYIYWEDVAETALLFSVKNEELKQCIQYLHDIADVLWFSDVDGLSEIVFHKPKALIDIFSSMYRHDINDFLDYDNKVFLCKGRLTKEQFHDTCEMFLNTGEISRPLLNCLWFNLNFQNANITEMLELLPLFEVCFAVPEPSVPEGPLYSRALMVLPWYNKDTDIAPLRLVWPEKSYTGDKELIVVYSFPFFFSPNIMPNLSSQIQEFVDERMDWKDYMYATSQTEKLLIKHTLEEGGHHTVAVAVRGPDFTEVQSLSREMIELINTQLLRYPGLYWSLNIPMGKGAIKLVDDTDFMSISRRPSRLNRHLSNMK